MIFQRPANIDANPLKLIERSEPLAGQGDILVSRANVRWQSD